MIKSVLKNLSWFGISQIIYRLLYFLILSVSARILTPTEHGLFTYFLLIGSLLMPLYSFGIDVTGIRDITVKKISESEYLVNNLLLKAVLIPASFIVVILYLYFSKGVSSLGDISIFFFIFLYLISSNLAESLHGILIANNRFKQLSLLIVIEKLLIAGVSITVLYYTRDILAFTKTMAVCAIVSFLLVFTVIAVKFNISFSDRSLRCAKYLFKQSYPIAIGMFATIWLSRVGVIYLDHQISLDQLAMFNNAFYSFYVIQVGVLTLMKVLFPQISKSSQKNNNETIRTIAKYSLFTLPIISLVAFTISVNSDSIILLLFGSSYIESSSIMSQFMLIVPFYCVASLIGNYLRAIYKQMHMTLFVIMGFAINIILLINLNIDPIKQVLFSYLISQIFIALIGIIYIYKFEYKNIK